MARSVTHLEEEDEDPDMSLNVEDLTNKQQVHQNEQAVDQARKQVRFSLADFNEILPSKKNQADTEIRRRSVQRESLPIPNPAETETEGHDFLSDDFGAGFDSIGDTPDEYFNKVDRDFNKYRYLTTTAELNHDLEEKLAKLAALYTRKGKIEFPFRALTAAGRDATKFKGAIDFEKWIQLVKENPEAMYQEMKIRAF